MATFKVCVQKKRADNTYPVYIRVIHNRKIAYMKTDKVVIKVGKGGEVKDTFILAPLNTLINEYINRLNKQDTKNWSVHEVISFLESVDEDVCFSTYAKAFTAKMYNNGQERNAKNYYLAIGHLERFLGTNQVMFSMLRKKVIDNWIALLEKTTARAKEMYPVCIRQIFKAAIAELNDPERNIIRIKTNPFLEVKIPQADMPDKKAVDVEKIRAFINAPLPPTKFIVQSAEMARDVAMLMLYLGGISTADIYSLKEEMCDDEAIRYNRCKTRGKRRDNAYFELPIPACAKELIKKYRADKGSGYYFNFYQKYRSFDSFNAGVNAGMRRLCEFNDMEIMSSYTFRHSFATICRNDLGYTEGDVAFAMNHSTGHKITEGYIREDWSRTTRMCEALYDYIVNGNKVEIHESEEEGVGNERWSRIVSSYKSLIYGTLYYKKKKIGELVDVGFSNIKEVIERLSVYLPDDIPEMAKVYVKIENADTGEMKVYERMVRGGKICVNDHH